MQPMLGVSCVDEVSYFHVTPHLISAPDNLWNYGEPNTALDNRVQHDKREHLRKEGVLLPDSKDYHCGNFTVALSDEAGITLRYKESTILSHQQFSTSMNHSDSWQQLEILSITANGDYLTLIYEHTTLAPDSSETNKRFVRRVKRYSGDAKSFKLHKHRDVVSGEKLWLE